MYSKYRSALEGSEGRRVQDWIAKQANDKKGWLCIVRIREG